MVEWFKWTTRIPATVMQNKNLKDCLWKQSTLKNKSRNRFD